MANMENRKSKTITLIVIALIICFAIGATVIRDNTNFNKGINALNNDRFLEAIDYLNNSNQSEAIAIIDAIKHHQSSVSYYEAKNYEQAYKETELIAETYPEYDKVKKIANDSLYIIINQKLQAAKDAFSSQDYTLAYFYLKTVLQYNPNQNEALQLKDTYLSKSEEMEKILAEKKAAEEEATKEILEKLAVEKEATRKAEAKQKGVKIGMTQQEVLESNWGEPEDINRTTYTFGVHEQWCYPGYNYLYFEDGILTTIQN